MAKKQIIKDGDSTHYALSNDFIRMPKRLDITGLQMFGLALSKIQWRNGYPKDLTVRFSIDEVRKACGSESHNYGWYKKALEELQKKALIKLERDDLYYSAVVFPTVRILRQNMVEVTFNNDLREYIQFLRTNYTVFRVPATAKFQSRYSYILYTNLRSWHDYSADREDALDERERYYTTAQLKQMFDLRPDEYRRKDGSLDRYNFEKKVIKVAVDEINDNHKDCGMWLEWRKEYVEGSRRVKHYVFHFIMGDWEEPVPGYYTTQ